MKSEGGTMTPEIVQELEDLRRMVGELPEEGKCAMMLVYRKDGEYIWGSMPFDFASYVIVDKGDDSYTGMDLCDPFSRADDGDRLLMAKVLRERADHIERCGDFLGVIESSKAAVEALSCQLVEVKKLLCECIPYVEGYRDGSEYDDEAIDLVERIKGWLE